MPYIFEDSARCMKPPLTHLSHLLQILIVRAKGGDVMNVVGGSEWQIRPQSEVVIIPIRKI